VPSVGCWRRTGPYHGVAHPRVVDGGPGRSATYAAFPIIVVAAVVAIIVAMVVLVKLVIVARGQASVEDVNGACGVELE
jgi:hypothetical protein